MANPNRSVAAWRNAKWSNIKTISADSQWDADERAKAARELYPTPKYRVRVSSYNIGPRGKALRQYVVRIYEVM